MRDSERRIKPATTLRGLGEGVDRLRRVIPAPASPLAEDDGPPLPAGAPTPGVGVAWPVMWAILVCLALVLLLNTRALIAVVERRPSGPTRTVLLAVARPLDRVASRVGLDRPA